MPGDDFDFGLDRSYAIADPRVASRVQHFPESVIREFTRLAQVHDAINLAQGYPDFDPPEELKVAAKAAIDGGYNQYSITWGARELREAVVAKVKRSYGLGVDPDENVVVTCGATEAMMATMLALINPGDEVVIFEPFYENYGPDALVSGARPRFVPMEPPGFTIDAEALKAAFGPRTKACILNTPNNPTGKVFGQEEMKLIADLATERDAIVVTDEIYEHILYDGAQHIPMATLGDMFERTVTISGLSKTYSVTGWRLGYTVAPKTLTDALRRTHDFLTVGAPHPLQMAAVAALNVPEAYYQDLASMYARKRRILYNTLQEVGFKPIMPRGAYYIMADISGLTREDDVAFANRLVQRERVAVVPGSSFYSRPEMGAHIVRFTFSKRDETLWEAARRLKGLGVVSP
jgi:aminotransferase